MSLEYNLNFIKDKSKKSTIKKAISILERAFYSRNELSSFFLDPYEMEVIESIAKKIISTLLLLGETLKQSERYLLLIIIICH